MPDRLLHITKLHKTYGAQRVLDLDSFQLRAGRVYGLLGANGSGKSTLVKVLSGYHSPDAGAYVEVRGAGQNWPLRPGTAGIAVVQQDPVLMPDFTILESYIVAKHGSRRRLEYLRLSRERSRARQSLQRVGLDLDLDTKIAEIGSPERALIVIATKLSDLDEFKTSPILVMDEPTANLAQADANRVLGAAKAIAKDGGAVVLVSHRLDEVRSSCDEVVVLRDGKASATGPIADFSDRDLLDAMFGGEPPRLGHNRLRSQNSGSSRALVRVTMEGRESGQRAPVQLVAMAGEFVGITGLVGMGQDQLPYEIVGALSRRGLVAEIDGRQLCGGPAEARRAGAVLVPADRAKQASWPAGSLVENFTVDRLGHYARRLVLSPKRERRDAAQAIRDWDVRGGRLDGPMNALSGGNQQKLILARSTADEGWKSMLIHEPTQGIDILNRQRILERLRKLADAGRTILCFTTDYDALAEVCDRVFIMWERQLVVELTGDAINAQRIAHTAMMPFAASTDRQVGPPRPEHVGRDKRQ